MSDFIKRRKQEWEELERLSAKASRRWGGISRMSAEELTRLDVLYRKTTIDLAQVASRTRDAVLLRYLNGLVAKAHAIIYAPVRKPFINRIGYFITDGFARSVARNGRMHLLALVLFCVGAFASYYAVRRDPSAAYALSTQALGPDYRTLGAGKENLISWLRHGRDTGAKGKTVFATQLFINNTRVGLLSLTSGIIAGVPTVFLILFNGLILGSFVSIYQSNGIYVELWAWLLPHGITEIGAIILCGGTGLLLGRAMVCPGELSRTESIRRAGSEALLTSCGIAIMLFFAALIESFLRQSNLEDAWRYVFAGGTLLFWVGYILRGYLLEKDSIGHDHIMAPDEA